MKGPHNYMRKDDEYETPEHAVNIILPYLKPNSTIWCPFDKNHSNYVKCLTKAGNTVINSHIEYGQDFFTMDVPKNIDYIVSNPPYSKKNQVYERLYEIGKPFAMLINASGFADSLKRATLFAEKGVQIMYIYPRVCYIKDGIQTKGNIFQSAYICKDVLPTDLMIHIKEKYHA